MYTPSVETKKKDDATTAPHRLSYLTVNEFNNINSTVYTQAVCFASYKLALIILKACVCYLQKFMYDFNSRGLCSLGPFFASCFKKMRNSKMKEKTQTQFEMMDN